MNNFIKRIRHHWNSKKEPEIRLLDTHTDLIQMPQSNPSEKIFNQLIFFYESGLKQLETKMTILSNEYLCSNERNPIENIKTRIKSPISIVTKLQRKGLEPTIDNLLNKIHDVAGMRIVCPFVSDIYDIEQFIQKQKDIKILKIKDYIQSPKPNGYRSLHLVLMIDVSFSEKLIKVPIEVQLRTISMNSWAALEHQLHYKKNYSFTSEMLQDLKSCADSLWENDCKMQSLLYTVKSIK